MPEIAGMGWIPTNEPDIEVNVDENGKAEIVTTTIHIYIECDACGLRDEVNDEVQARIAVRAHAAHCRKAHKGVAR